MRIPCPICNGRGWSDKTLETAGTNPPCEPCGGIGTINIFAIQKEVAESRAKLNKIYELLQEAKTIAAEGIWGKHYDGLESVLVSALIELGK